MALAATVAGLLFPLWAVSSYASLVLHGPRVLVNVSDVGRESPDYGGLSSVWPERAVPACQGGEHFFRDFLKCDASLDYCYEFRERSCVGFDNWACAHTLNRRVSWAGARTNIFIKNVGLGNTRCCAGRYQSPIDIPPSEAKCIRGMHSPNYVNPEQLVAGTSKNKGYHPAFYANDTYFQTPPLLLGGVPFTCTVPGSDHYVFHSLHVHSSYLDTYRSDHAVDGKHYDGEIHLVHVREDFWHKGKSDKRCASQTPLGLVVLAVFLSITEGQPNLEFNRLVNPLILTIIRDTHVKCPFEEMCGESRNSYSYGLFNSSNNDLCRDVTANGVGADLSKRRRRGIPDSPRQGKQARLEPSSIAKGTPRRVKRDLNSHSPRLGRGKTPADEEDDSDEVPAAATLADESYEEYSEIDDHEEVEEVVEELLSVEDEEDYEEEDDFETAGKGKAGGGWPPGTPGTPPGANDRAPEAPWIGKGAAPPGPSTGGSGNKLTSPEAGARKVVCFCQQARQQERAMPWAGRGEAVQCRIKYKRGRPLMEDVPPELDPAQLLPAPPPVPPEPYDPNSTPLFIRPGLMLPQGRDYFQYFGSLTTPPCSEVVNWIVFREPIRITQEQMNYLHRLESRRANHVVSEFGDVRPTQPINGRTILTNAC